MKTSSMEDWTEQKSRKWALESNGPKFKPWLCHLQLLGDLGQVIPNLPQPQFSPCKAGFKLLSWGYREEDTRQGLCGRVLAHSRCSAHGSGHCYY